MKVNEFFERVCSVSDFKDCITEVLSRIEYDENDDAACVLRSFAETAE